MDGAQCDSPWVGESGGRLCGFLSTANEDSVASDEAVLHDFRTVTFVLLDGEAGFFQAVPEVSSIPPAVILCAEVQSSIMFGNDGRVFIGSFPCFGDGNCDDEHSSRNKDAANLVEGCAILYMFEDVHGNDGFERAIGQIDFLNVEDH